jgi:NhaP-type Na+/H+ or K+/H+ antiporter
VSYIAEAFIFAYLGASILGMSENWTAGLMGLVLVVFLPLVRAVMVYVLPVLYWACKKPFYLGSKELKVTWFAGIIRGVIAFALCLQVESANKDFAISLVLVIVLVTTVGGSSFLNKFI